MYVFVYGTLKREYPNNYVLNDGGNGVAEYYCDGKTMDKYPLIIATKYDVPFVLDKVGQGKNIQGEVYKIDEKMLEFLDKFERNPEVYTRREVEIEVLPSSSDGDDNQPPAGASITAWMFVFHTFRAGLLTYDFLERYICNNYAVLRALSGKVGPEERKELLMSLRD